MATQPAPQAQDRISIGPPSAERARTIILERDRELTNEPAGDGSGRSPSSATTGASAQNDPERSSSLHEDQSDVEDGLDLPFRVPGRGREGGRAAKDGAGKSIASSFQRWQRSLQAGNWSGGGGGRQMGPLFFDPAGADFTSWMNHFKNEVYRNWVVPQGALIGFRGRVELSFTVIRNGQMIDLRLVRSAGTTFLDRAAANALLGSRFLPLPTDYRPETVTMGVTFFYNEDPRSS